MAANFIRHSRHRNAWSPKRSVIAGLARRPTLQKLAHKDGFPRNFMSEMPSFFAELKRRNVYKVAIAYAVAAWLLIQIATQVFPFFEIPNWAVRLVVLLVIVGFPVALIFSWAFEITPEGIKRESDIESDKSITHHTGRKIVALTVVLAVIAAGFLAVPLFRARSTTAPANLARPADQIPERASPCCRSVI